VSHTSERREKDCLNCGALVLGRYCQNCGQENVEPKETFWHMVTHFFYDITHFDGSFFVTVKDLLFRPGFLSKEYKLGRRKKYLHPIRMYMFTSFVFFLVFYTVYHVSEKDISVKGNNNTDWVSNAKEAALKKAKTKEDTIKIYNQFERMGLKNARGTDKKDSLTRNDSISAGGLNFTFSKDVNEYRSVTEYDSVQRALPPGKRDNWLVGIITRKLVELNLRYEGDQRRIATEIVNKFLHAIPYMLFVSLPLYALFLKLLYIRRKKEFYFADHGIFLIHLYIFTFLLLLLYIGIDQLETKMSWDVMVYVKTILVLAGLIYAIVAMKKYYNQSRGKTILKFILFNILCLFSLGILFAVFLSLSFYQI